MAKCKRCKGTRSVFKQSSVRKPCPDCEPTALGNIGGSIEDDYTPIGEHILTPTSDPWEYRADGMKCKTCIWFVTKKANGPANKSVGRCRKNAPTMGGFPVVFVDDWCGNHRLDENEI